MAIEFNKISWTNKKKGYECSSEGDKRFSAFNAILEDGRSIEQHYQCDIKGYDPGGTNWELGKDKSPLNKDIKLFPLYLNLWKQWFNIGDNFKLIDELYQLATENDNFLSDKFAKTPVNQAHALSVIINEYNKNKNAKVSIDLYTDGSCNPNPGFAGYGFYAVDTSGNLHLGCGPVGINSTNNVAELLAVAYGVLRIREKVPNVSKLKILSDSKYVLSNYKNINTWRENGFLKTDGNPVANKDIWVYLDSVIKDAKDSGISITFEWVEGHNGTKGNELADHWANQGRLITIKNDTQLTLGLADDHFYEYNPFRALTKTESNAPGLNRLLAIKRWLFFTNSPREIEGKPFYFGSTYEDKKDMNNKNCGKRAPDSLYCMLMPKEKISLLDSIRDMYDKKFTNSESPVIIHLDEVSNKGMWYNLNRTELKNTSFKGDALIENTDGTLLGELHFPPKLYFRIPAIVHQAYIYIKDFLNTSPDLIVFDITNYFYNVDDKGKFTMNNNFSTSDKYLDIKIKIPFNSPIGIITPEVDDTIRLTVDIDMPIRNVFSALIKQSKDPVKVSLIITDSLERTCRVATIIEYQNDIAVYFSPDSNLRIKR